MAGSTWGSVNVHGLMRVLVVGDIFRDTFLGFVRVHVLYHAAKGKVFGLEMIEELREHGYDVSPGTLYPIFHGLEKAGYLDAEQELVAGKLRKYYRITASGAKVLDQLRDKIRELTREVLDDRPAAAPKPARKSRR